jgi:predicted outer membrane repeat protein
MMNRTVFGFRLMAMVVLVCTLCASPQAAHAGGQALCYVDAAAPGPTHDGNSWATAYTSLQTALDPCGEIWVKAGVYKPGTGQSDTFPVREGQHVYGGFAGTESLASQRQPLANLTVLSGDIDSDDSNVDGNHIDEVYTDIAGTNSTHVVTMNGTGGIPITSDTVLDGFIITGGDGGSIVNGGGLLCDGHGSGHGCSPTLSQLVFSGNRGQNGGALCNDGSDSGASNPTVTNATFQGNTAIYGNGGAVYNYGPVGISNPVFTDVTFTGNSAYYNGGAVMSYAHYGTSNPTFTNVTFQGNSASNWSGAYYSYAYMGSGSATFTNVTINGNSAPNGGALTFSGTSTATLTNVILWGDTYEIANNGGTINISHSIVQGCGNSGASWDTTCGTDLGGNIDADPLLSPLWDNGGFTKTMSLIWGSPAIDAGADSECSDGMLNCADQRGVERTAYGHFDIGALERIPPGARADIESDGISDLGYFHAATGLWGVLQSSDDFSFSTSQFITWGQTGDIVVTGDYDGDGRWDPAVRRPPAGGQSAAYLILKSTMNYYYSSSLTIPAGWPGLGDTPVPGDFNGDGIMEPAIWRGNTGVWIIPLSPTFTSYAFYAWGQSGDTPVGADVDGDGQTDIGYWRPSTGVWGFLQSSQGYSYASPLFFNWGTTGNIAVMADYDGDRLADPAVVIPPAGGQSRAYRILLSTLAYNPALSVTIPAGWPGLNDTPVPADYDGDGKADAGIWRGNTGVWIIPMSSTGNTSYIFRTWGASGDQIAR